MTAAAPHREIGFDMATLPSHPVVASVAIGREMIRASFKVPGTWHGQEAQVEFVRVENEHGGTWRFVEVQSDAIPRSHWDWASASGREGILALVTGEGGSDAVAQAVEAAFERLHATIDATKAIRSVGLQAEREAWSRLAPEAKALAMMPEFPWDRALGRAL